MRQAVIDFETHPIEQRPKYPPVPVGLACILPGKIPSYAAWGHDSENGIFILKDDKLRKVDGDPKKWAAQHLKDAVKCDSVLGHNIAKFDSEVSAVGMGVKIPDRKIDDSLFSRFIVDPRAKSLSLKPAAEEVLGEPPEERDAVFEWLYEHGLTSRKKVDGRYVYGSKDNPAGKWIYKAPGPLVARYAIGDCMRSRDLFEHDMEIIKRDGMEAAYQLELDVAPILRENERAGVRLDMELLRQDRAAYTAALVKVEAWLRKKLGAPAGINWDSDEEVATALRKSGQVKIFPKTATNKDSVSKSRLTKEFFRDESVYLALAYRSTVAYVMSQNIVPWSESLDGRAYTSWDQVRGADKGGAKTGRITCSKFANIIKDPTGGKNPDYLVADDEKVRNLVGLPPIPLARRYILPEKGESFGHVDWSQQEIRITAHYEDGALAQAYRDNPKEDIHQYCTNLINSASGQAYLRGVIKHVNLRKFYGGGTEGLVTHPMLRLDKVYHCKLDCHHREDRCPAMNAAYKIDKDWAEGLPDVVNLIKRLKGMYQRGLPIRTIGGRLYHCKPDGLAVKGPRKGQMTNFSYMALNDLVQPSAADHLKQALVKWHKHPKREASMLGTVYDEINISAPKKVAKQQVRLLQDVMESTPLDVPYRTDGDVRANWGEKP